jgi:hypothetical protein
MSTSVEVSAGHADRSTSEEVEHQSGGPVTDPKTGRQPFHNSFHSQRSETAVR